jgi:hypothetical protein
MEATQSTVASTPLNKLTDDEKDERRYKALKIGATSLTNMYSEHVISNNADIDYMYKAVKPYVFAYSGITGITDTIFRRALTYTGIALQFSGIDVYTPEKFCNSIGKTLPKIFYYGKDLEPKELDPANTSICLSELENFILMRYKQMNITRNNIPKIVEYSQRLLGGSKKRSSASTRRRTSRRGKSSATKRRRSRRPHRRTSRK